MAAAVLAWASEQGADVSRVTLVGRKLIGTEIIKPGERIVSVPQHLLLTPSLIDLPTSEFQAAFGRLREQSQLAREERAVLVLLLLLERAKGPASKWSTYISFLPKIYEDPCWWTAEDLARIEGTRLSYLAQQHRSSLADLRVLRDKLIDICRGFEEIERTLDLQWAGSEEAIRWARSTVWSRGFNVFLNEMFGAAGDRTEKGICLVPVADMLDHSPQQHVAWHTGRQAEDSFEILTYKEVQKGQEIFSNYGHKSNEELILSYGFALPGNAADFFHVALKVHTGPTDDLEAQCQGLQRQAVMRVIGLSSDHYLKRAAPLPASLLAASAVCAMSDASVYELLQQPHVEAQSGEKRALDVSSGGTDVAEQRSGNGKLEVEGCTDELQSFSGPPKLPLSPRRELKALGSLLSQLQGKLRELPQSPANRSISLSAADVSCSNAESMASVYLDGQKEIATSAIKAVQSELDGLLRATSGAANYVGLLDYVGRKGAAEEGSMSSASLSICLPTGCGLEDAVRKSIDAASGNRDWQGWKVGLSIDQGLAAGTTIMRFPRDAMWIAEDRVSLELLALRHVLQLVWGEAVLDSHYICSLLLGGAAQCCGTDVLTQGRSKLEEGGPEEVRAASDQFLQRAEQLDLFALLPAPQQAQLYAWTKGFVDRCSQRCPHGLAILPLVSAVPREIRETIFSVHWDDGNQVARVISECDLSADTFLTEALLIIGESSVTVAEECGERALCMLQSIKVEEESDRSWLQTHHELILSPPPEDPDADLKLQILAFSTLGTTHYLGPKIKLGRLIAAVAVCSAKRKALSRTGCVEALERDITRNPTGQARWKQQKMWDLAIKRLLSSESTMKVAVKQLKAILSAERAALREQAPTEGSSEVHKAWTAYQQQTDRTLKQWQQALSKAKRGTDTS